MALIIGPRRTGKSVMLKQILYDLLTVNRVPPHQILFFEFSPSDPEESVWDVYSLYKAEIGNPNLPTYFLLDEIQFVPQYESAIKLLYDNHQHIKFFLTGSLSLTYKRRMSESLAGRFLPYDLFPLKFNEYLTLVNSPLLSQVSDVESQKPLVKEQIIENLNYEFRTFLRFGRLPELPTLASQLEKQAYIESALNQSTSQDAFEYFNIEQPQTIRAIFNYVSQHNGSLLNIQNLANQTGASRSLISKYLDVLETMRLIYPIYNTKNVLHKLNAARKAYVSSHVAFLHPIYDLATSYGFAVEAYIVERLLERGKTVTFFRHRDREIDVVLPTDRLAYEVKFSSHLDHLSFLQSFCSKETFAPHVVTLQKSGVENGITFTPACLF